MRTGEGKTLVATLPAYLNALAGKGTHIVTVNEYLAQRDADWMAPIYRFLGLTVGVVKAGQTPDEKRAAYGADITYGTNNEFGFDYLRDNLAFRLEDRMQRGLEYAIVDEVDSILIDEARTPLIISGPAEESTELYIKINELVPRLKRQEEEEGEGDYWADEKGKQVHLSDAGHERVEELFTAAGLLGEGESLYDAGNIRLMHHLNAALRSHALYRRDVEYIVRNGEVIIVDEFTGRTMPGRRWSDGLHQAVEAKERVRVREENQTVASITFQNYFRMYRKLSGMTGTADTEAFEFQQIYGLEVVVIPTHKPMVRADHADLVYLTQKDKYEAIIEDIRDCVARKQPALVGTTSVETSEFLSGLLTEKRIEHQVLNAKQHEREAIVVAQAGRPGTVTIATNMAGRGTDIVLGGNPKTELEQIPADDQAARAAAQADWQTRHEQVVAAGGLHIVGTERHESRRIDNQLRGRSGRQGDPGSSRFYLSLEDNLMRIFGDPNRTKRWLQTAGMKEGEVIESKMLSRQIERAQRKVEAYNFDLRKNLLEYDDVANDQRKVIYQQRTELMAAEDIADSVAGIRAEVVDAIVDDHAPRESVEEEWDLPALAAALEREFSVKVDPQAWMEADKELTNEGLRERLVKRGRGRLSTQGRAGRGAGHAAPREGGDAAGARSALARAPRGDGLPAAGHTPARLRAEEPEAGVQARVLRALQRAARPHQARHDHAAVAPAGAKRSRDRGAGARARTAARATAADAARRTGESAIASTAEEPPVGAAPLAAAPARAPRRADRPGTDGRARADHAGGARSTQGRPQRALPLRLGEEIQALPRCARPRSLKPRSRSSPVVCSTPPAAS